MTADNVPDRNGRALGGCAPSGRPGAPVGWLLTMAHEADLQLTPTQLRRGLGAVALLGAGFGALQGGLVGVPVGMVVAVVGALVALKANGHRRRRSLEAQLPGFLEAVARGLRTGLQLGPATVEAAAVTPPPLKEEVAPVADELGRGLRAADVFERWARRHPHRGAGLAAAAMAFAAAAGGARAQAIDGVAATLRDRAALELEVRSLTSQARASALMIAALPVGFLLMSSSVGDRSANFLFTNRLGLVLLAMGLSLDALGALWMHRIVNARD
ncbi:type II secretion system F family protein [Candidatus Poriferisocius sp.]|uniref:type II secretion system F family protein n=1 Tax=Candidatus Poriferisocius sp. TaxID=3101276 RepID=UPI003B5ADED4